MQDRICESQGQRGRRIEGGSARRTGSGLLWYEKSTNQRCNGVDEGSSRDESGELALGRLEGGFERAEEMRAKVTGSWSSRGIVHVVSDV